MGTPGGIEFDVKVYISRVIINRQGFDLPFRSLSGFKSPKDLFNKSQYYSIRVSRRVVFSTKYSYDLHLFLMSVWYSF